MLSVYLARKVYKYILTPTVSHCPFILIPPTLNVICPFNHFSNLLDSPLQKKKSSFLFTLFCFYLFCLPFNILGDYFNDLLILFTYCVLTFCYQFVNSSLKSLSYLLTFSFLLLNRSSSYLCRQTHLLDFMTCMNILLLGFISNFKKPVTPARCFRVKFSV